MLRHGSQGIKAPACSKEIPACEHDGRECSERDTCDARKEPLVAAIGESGCRNRSDDPASRGQDGNGPWEFPVDGVPGRSRCGRERHHENGRSDRLMRREPHGVNEQEQDGDPASCTVRAADQSDDNPSEDGCQVVLRDRRQPEPSKAASRWRLGGVEAFGAEDEAEAGRKNDDGGNHTEVSIRQIRRCPATELRTGDGSGRDEQSGTDMETSMSVIDPCRDERCEDVRQ